MSTANTKEKFSDVSGREITKCSTFNYILICYAFQRDCDDCLEGMCRYRRDRASLLLQDVMAAEQDPGAAADPVLADLRRFDPVTDLDLRQYEQLRRVVAQLRSHYAIVADFAGKNWNKICRPSGEDGEHSRLTYYN